MLHIVEVPGRTAAQPRALNALTVARHWRCWFVLGLLSTLFGATALFAGGSVPAAYLVPLVGSLLAADSLLQFGRAGLLPRYAGSGWHPLAGTLAAAAAALMLLDPGGGPVPANLVLGLFLLASGVGKSFLGVMLDPLRGCYWLFAAGIATAAFGIALLLLLPQASGQALLGPALGSAMLLEGYWTLRVARGARRDGVAALLPRYL